MAYPVTFEMDYVEKRSRLTTFFRLFLAIPHFIFLYLYGLAAGIVVVVAWFVLLFTARWPLGMYDFVAGYLRYATRVYGYFWLGTDEYPPFSGSATTPYPVRLNVDAPLADYSRLKVFFRIILMIPPLIINYAMQIVAQVGAFLAWFAIVVLGRQPKGLQDMVGLGLSYHQRSSAYFALLTEDWPPFTDDSTAQVGAAPTFGSLPPTQQTEAPVLAAPGEYAPPAPAEAEPEQPPQAAPPPPHGDPLADETQTERIEREDDEQPPPAPASR